MTAKDVNKRLMTLHISEFPVLAKVLKAVNHGKFAELDLTDAERDIVARKWMQFDDAAKRQGKP